MSAFVVLVDEAVVDEAVAFHDAHGVGIEVVDALQHEVADMVVVGLLQR